MYNKSINRSCKICFIFITFLSFTNESFEMLISHVIICRKINNFLSPLLFYTSHFIENLVQLLKTKLHQNLSKDELHKMIFLIFIFLFAFFFHFY